MKAAFYIREDSLYGSGLYSVFQRGRYDQWGEPYCIDSYISYERAKALCDQLNAGIDMESISILFDMAAKFDQMDSDEYRVACRYYHSLAQVQGWELAPEFLEGAK